MTKSNYDFWAAGISLSLRITESCKPTPFSSFLACSLSEPGQSDALAADAGTGCGVLAIVLAHLGFEHVIAFDSSEVACELAEFNVRTSRRSSQIEIVHSTVEGFSHGASFDLMVSNPPTLPSVQTVPDFAQASDDDNLGFVRALADWCFTGLRDDGQVDLVFSSLVSESACRIMECALSQPLSRWAALALPLRRFYYDCFDSDFMQDGVNQGRLRSDTSPGTEAEYSEIVSVFRGTMRQRQVVRA